MYKEKYLKYKQKYLNLKYGGKVTIKKTDGVSPNETITVNEYFNRVVANGLMKKHRLPESTDDDIKLLNLLNKLKNMIDLFQTIKNPRDPQSYLKKYRKIDTNLTPNEKEIKNKLYTNIFNHLVDTNMTNYYSKSIYQEPNSNPMKIDDSDEKNNYYLLDKDINGKKIYKFNNIRVELNIDNKTNITQIKEIKIDHIDEKNVKEKNYIINSKDLIDLLIKYKHPCHECLSNTKYNTRVELVTGLNLYIENKLKLENPNEIKKNTIYDINPYKLIMFKNNTLILQDATNTIIFSYKYDKNTKILEILPQIDTIVLKEEYDKLLKNIFIDITENLNIINENDSKLCGRIAKLIKDTGIKFNELKTIKNIPYEFFHLHITDVYNEKDSYIFVIHAKTENASNKISGIYNNKDSIYEYDINELKSDGVNRIHNYYLHIFKDSSNNIIKNIYYVNSSYIATNNNYDMSNRTIGAFYNSFGLLFLELNYINSADKVGLIYLPSLGINDGNPFGIKNTDEQLGLMPRPKTTEPFELMEQKIGSQLREFGQNEDDRNKSYLKIGNKIANTNHTQIADFTDTDKEIIYNKIKSMDKMVLIELPFT
jgi:hypothetical protein